MVYGYKVFSNLNLKLGGKIDAESFRSAASGL